MTFETGNLFMTRGINEEIKHSNKFNLEIFESVKRYFNCDWGELCDEDKALNDLAVQNGDDRIVAKYSTSVEPIYIITEWDRSATTILFCNEY